MNNEQWTLPGSLLRGTRSRKYGPDHESVDQVAKAAPCLRLRPYSSSFSTFMADLHRKSDSFSGRMVLSQSPHIFDETPTPLSFPKIPHLLFQHQCPCGPEGGSGQRRSFVFWATTFSSVSLSSITLCFTTMVNCRLTLVPVLVFIVPCNFALRGEIYPFFRLWSNHSWTSRITATLHPSVGEPPLALDRWQQLLTCVVQPFWEETGNDTSVASAGDFKCHKFGERGAVLSIAAARCAW